MLRAAQVANASGVMMAALAQLAEQAATQKPSAEPHQLRPLPFLIYLADGDTVTLPPPPYPKLPRRSAATAPGASNN